MYGAFYGSWWMWISGFMWYYFITIASSSAGYHRFYSHEAFKAGRIPKKRYASASSPEENYVFEE